MKFSLAALTRRVRTPRRKQIPIREIAPPGTLATDLFRAFYLPVIEAWAEAQSGIAAEYERTLSEITTDAICEMGGEYTNPISLTDSPTDLDATITTADGAIRRLILSLTPRLRDWLVRVESWHRGKWRDGVLSASGVDLQTLIGPEDVAQTLETMLETNAALVRDISDQARGRIAGAVFRGLTNRTAAREVAKEIAEAVGMARRRALNIAADQLSKATSALDTERMRQAGIDEWIWRHSGKLHARPEHVARNGRTYSFTDPPPDMPGELPWCGCRKQAVVAFE